MTSHGILRNYLLSHIRPVFSTVSRVFLNSRTFPKLSNISIVFYHLSKRIFEMEAFLTNRTPSTIMQEINEVERGMRNLITEGQSLMEACDKPKDLTESQAKAIVERKKEFSERAYTTLHTMKTSGFFGRLHDHFIIERLELFAERDKPTLPERMREATEEERDEWVENRRNEVNQRLADLEEDELDLIQEHLEMVDQIEYIYHELFMS